jgi:hypothetical protein
MAIQVQTFQLPTMVSGNSVTSGMQVPGCFVYMYLEVPTMSAGYTVASTPIYVQASSDGVTYRRFTNSDNTANTLVVGLNDYVVASSVSQRMIPLTNFSFGYVRIEVSGAATGNAASPPPFKLICVSNQ